MKPAFQQVSFYAVSPWSPLSEQLAEDRCWTTRGLVSPPASSGSAEHSLGCWADTSPGRLEVPGLAGAPCGLGSGSHPGPVMPVTWSGWALVQGLENWGMHPLAGG